MASIGLKDHVSCHKKSNNTWEKALLTCAAKMADRKKQMTVSVVTLEGEFYYRKYAAFMNGI